MKMGFVIKTPNPIVCNARTFIFIWGVFLFVVYYEVAADDWEALG